MSRKSGWFLNSLRLLLLLILAVIAWGTLTSTPIRPPAIRPVPTPLPTRAIVGSDLSLHEIWRKTSLRLGGGSGSADTPSSRILIAAQEAVYAVEYNPLANDQVSTLRIIALDVKTGTQWWGTEQFGYIDSLALGQNTLFVATTDGIRAYDATSGKRKWTSNQPPPAHQEYSLFFDESQLTLLIRWGSQYLFSTIDPESGLVGEIREAKRIPVKIDSQFWYMWNGEEFWLEDITTSRVRWVIPISESPDSPIKSENLLVIPTVQYRPGWHSVIVVNADSGQKMWECLDCYASDVAVDKDRLYGILRDGSLAAYDIRTGQSIGTVRFVGDGELGPLNTQYSIAAANGFVFLYFEDSQELIALGP